jgi:hypothetical protein
MESLLDTSRVVTPSATTRFHTTATHAFPYTTETPEHHFAAVANTITPADGHIRPKHVELYTTCNKAIHCLHQVGYSFTLWIRTSRALVYLTPKNAVALQPNNANSWCHHYTATFIKWRWKKFRSTEYFFNNIPARYYLGWCIVPLACKTRIPKWHF